MKRLIIIPLLLIAAACYGAGYYRELLTLPRTAGSSVAWTPATATSDGFLPAAWYAADSLTGYTNGQTVSSMDDKSGNLHTLHTGVNATFAASQIGGAPAVLLSSGYFVVSNSIAWPVTNMVYLVAKGTDTSRIITFGNTTTTPYTFYRLADTNGYWLGSPALSYGYAKVSMTNYTMIAAGKVDTAFVLRVNASSVAVTTVTVGGSTAAITRFGRRGTDQATAYYVECLLYTNNVTSSDVETYLKNKYGL